MPPGQSRYFATWEDMIVGLNAIPISITWLYLWRILRLLSVNSVTVLFFFTLQEAL